MNTLSKTMMMMTNKRVAEEKSKAKNFAPGSSVAASCELLIQNYSNFKRSSCPDRVMFYEDGSWIDYPSELVELIKLGFMDGKPAVEAQVLGSNCLFDFYRMLEINLESGNQRSISWIDVHGKCFFPKTFVNTYEIDSEDDDFVNCGEGFQKIQIDIKVRENSVSSEGLKVDEAVNLSKRKRGEGVIDGESEGSLSSTNVKRQMVGSESQLARWPKTRILGAEEEGFGIVKNLLLSGFGIVEPVVTVTSVHQCIRMGPFDRARREVFAKQLEVTKKARGEGNLVFAWYGASAKGVESILTHGFGISSNLSHSKGHGIGIYLSPIRLPRNSAMLAETDENGEKHLLLCRVILGKCEKVEAGSKQSYPSSVEYDTGVDDINSPRWYTVWHANMNTHILPECVVSYRPVNMSGSIKANTSRITSASVFVAKLFSKLRGSIPQPRLQELQTLWGFCKEGKLGRDSFMKQLRSVVGDDVLRSTIQEIRG